MPEKIFFTTLGRRGTHCTPMATPMGHTVKTSIKDISEEVLIVTLITLTDAYKAVIITSSQESTRFTSCLGVTPRPSQTIWAV